MADINKLLNKAKDLFAEGKINKGLSILLDLLENEMTFKSFGSQIMNLLVDAGKKNPETAFPYIAKYYKSEKKTNAKKRILSLFNTFIEEQINIKEDVDETNPWYSFIQTLKKSKDQELLNFAIKLISIRFDNKKEDFIKNYHWIVEIIGNETIYNSEYGNQKEIYAFFGKLVGSDTKSIDIIIPALKKMLKSEIIASKIEAIKAIGHLSLYNISKFEEFISIIQKLISIKNVQFRSYVVQALGRFGYSDFNTIKHLLSKMITFSFYPDLIPGLTKVLALHIQDHTDELLNEIREQFDEKKLKEGILSLLQNLTETSSNKVDEGFLDSLLEIEKSKKIISKLQEIKNSLKGYEESFRICPVCFSNNKMTSKFCAKDEFLIFSEGLEISEELKEKEEKEEEVETEEKVEEMEEVEEEMEEEKEIEEEEEKEEKEKEEEEKEEEKEAEVEVEEKKEIKEEKEVEEEVEEKKEIKEEKEAEEEIEMGKEVEEEEEKEEKEKEKEKDKKREETEIEKEEEDREIDEKNEAEEVY